VYSVESFLTLMMVHLLKLRIWPDSDTCSHWRGRLSGSNRARTSTLPPLCGRRSTSTIRTHGIKRLKAEAPNTAFPAENPFTLDHLLREDWSVLLNRLPSAA
jgi:hypothetical protein